MYYFYHSFFVVIRSFFIVLVFTCILVSGCDSRDDQEPQTDTIQRDPYQSIDQTPVSMLNDQGGVLVSNDMMQVAMDFQRIRLNFTWEGDDFYRMPWPSDARLTAQGHADLSDFPSVSPVMDKIKNYIQSSIRGFSLMPVIYIPFQDPIEEQWLPTLEDSTSVESPVQLIDLDPQQCSRRIPIELKISQAQDQYVQDHVLQIRNTWGTVLTPGRPHAVIILNTLGDEQHSIVSPDEFQQAWQGDDHPASSSLQPLKDCLPQLGLQAEHIAMATVFTPQDPRQKLLALHQHVTDPEKVTTQAVHSWERSEGWSRRRLNLTTMQGLLPMPIFQQGDTPYETSGGNILLNEQGQAEIQRWEDVPIAVSFKEDEAFNDTPRPVLVFIDGTGWRNWTHLYDNWIYEALDQGYIVYSFMPQFHGQRAGFMGSDMLATFNLLNPAAGGNNFVQQAIEISYFARAIREQIHTLTGLPTSNTDRMLYAAQSQGSVCGAIHASISDQFSAYVLNGVSSSITLTMLYRDDLLNFREVMSGFLQTTPEALDLFHPALQLIQLGSDAVDPNSYAPYWKGWEGQPWGNHVWMINGKNDQTTRPLGMANLTMVAQAHPLAPLEWDIDPYGVSGIMEIPWPVSATQQSFSNTPLIITSFLDAERGHYTIYRRFRLRKAVYSFWQSVLEGMPQIKSTSEFTCDDGEDEDQDGLVDCDDPDCSQRVGCQEQECDDGLDNDGDEKVDCADEGCQDVVPCIELCQNGEDDNQDGLVDCDDPLCQSKDACTEKYCDDDLDGDDDGLIDCDDPDCAASLHCPETLCDDGEDQNQNAAIDCDDVSCSWSSVCRGPYEEICDDGLDDDMDGLLDCDDSDCAAAPSCIQAEACWQIDLQSQVGFMLYQGHLDMMSNRYLPGDCTGLGSGEGSQDFGFLWIAPQHARYQISTYGSQLDTVLTLYQADMLNDACTLDFEVACNDDQNPVQSSQIIYEAQENEALLIVVSAYNADEASDLFRLHINQVIELE